MKNFFKKIAFVLALAMVLTNIGPMAAVSAAEVPSLRYSSRVLYVGGDATGKYTNDCWTPSQNTKGYTVSYKVTEGANLVEVASNGKITATGKGIGKAVVTVTYKKAGEKDITAKFTIKVRRNATDVRLTNASQAAIETALKVGDELTLKAAKSFVGKSYKTGNFGVDNYRKLVSDQLEIVSSNPDVVKVDGFKITAVAAGTATIKVVAKQYLTGEATGVESPAYPVVVIGGLVGVKQTTANKIQVTMAQAEEDLTADDFKVSQVESTVDFSIKEITFSADKKVVTIETYSDMNDGKEYKVTYDEKDYTFTATDGVVAKIVNNKSQIPYNFATTISVDLVDANGIVLDTVDAKLDTNYDVDFDVEVSNGYMSDAKLTLYAKGDTAKLTVTYRTGQYDTNGNELGTLTETFTITAMDVAVDATLKSTITDAIDTWNTPHSTYDWKNIAVDGGDKSIEVDKSRILNIYITDEEGNDISQSLINDYGYYIDSSSENILSVGSAAAHSCDKDFGEVGIYIDINGVKAGTANVLIKNDAGRTVYVIPVTVKATSKFKSFNLGTSSITLSNTKEADDIGTVSVIGQSQYGDATWQDYADYITVELQSSQGNGPFERVKYQPYNGDGIYNETADGLTYLVFNGNGCEAGTYRYKVTLTKDDVTAVKYVNVVLKTPSGTDTYKLVIGGKTDSACAGWPGYANNAVTIKVAHYKGGVLYQYLDYGNGEANTIESVTITNGNYKTTLAVSGTAVAAIQGGKEGFAELGSSAFTADGKTYNYVINRINPAIEVKTGVKTQTGVAVEKTVKGSRTVRATLYNGKGTKVTLTSSGFTVTDTQAPMTATVDKTSVTNKNTIHEFIREVLTFRYNGKTITDDAEENRISITGITGTHTSTKGTTGLGGTDAISAGDKITVKAVKLRYEVEGGHFVEYEISVNRVFYIN